VASGFQFAELDCGTTVVPYDANCDTHPTKTFEEGLDYMGGDPYWLLAAQSCGIVGRSLAEIEAGVRRAFASDEQRAVESVVWNGDGAGALPFLTDATATVTTVVPTAPGAGAAISALEAAFYAVHGYAGTIHINTAAYGALAYADLLYPTAGVLTTLMRSRWSIGAGYGITGPADVAPAAGFVWAFMTPQVFVKRTASVNVPNIAQTLNRTTNQYQAVAERVYAHAWMCDLVFAVQVPVAAPAVAATPAVP
jgi:hypothetical protein